MLIEGLRTAYGLLPEELRAWILVQRRSPLWLRSGIVFVHIPKAAGTSFNQALYGRFMGHVTRPLDSKLWDEAQAFGDELEKHARKVFAGIDHDLGGGGDYRFLYWLTRYRRPSVIVETGVAAGWSSQAFLSALKTNRKGRLYSSDLPMFRLPNPERFVGILVEPELRENWSLELDGDELNLPRILAKVETIDIVHYDSDKMASGRDFAIGLLKPRLSPGGIIIMDDIFNDDWFRNYVTSTGAQFHVVDREYGIIGEIAGPPFA